MQIILKNDHLLFDNKVKYWSHDTLPIGPVAEIIVHTLTAEATRKALRQAKKVAETIIVTHFYNKPEIKEVIMDFVDKYHLEVEFGMYCKISNHRKPSFSHAGDVGDTLAGLLTIRNFGGGDLYLRPHGQVRSPYTEEKVKTLLPLLEQQGYIKKVHFGDSEEAIQLDLWRQQLQNTDLATEHLRCFGAPEDYSPWLTVEPKQTAEIVIARSPRYRSWAYRYWLNVLDHYRQFSKVFVGLREEHLDFCDRFGPIDWCETKDYLHLAQVIAGSKLVICNQSSPCWVSLALGKKMVQESSKQCLNCLLPQRDLTAIWQEYGPQALPSIT